MAKKYALFYSTHRAEISHSFIVQGHYRTYKDDRFVNMKNKTIKIFPYIKGIDLPSDLKEFVEYRMRGN
jgi:hypothetical protein